MRRIKLLGVLAFLMTAACLLSSCSLGVQFLQAYLDTRETEEIPAQETVPVRETKPPLETKPPRETAPADWGTPAPPSNPPVVPTAPPEVAQPVDEPPDEPELFYGPGWFEGVMGSRFYLPEGFVQQSNEGRLQGAGVHTNVFLNNELGLEIDVVECALAALPGSPAEEYEIMSSAAGVTYATAGNSFYVVSGYFDAKNIYYTRVDYDQTFYHSVSFYYPTVTSDACEEILLEFLRNYSTD